jgi:hypothetical protein
MKAPRLVTFNIFETVDNPVSDLEISRPLFSPAPAFQRARTDGPATGKFKLVQMFDEHGALPRFDENASETVRDSARRDLEG